MTAPPWVSPGPNADVGECGLSGVSPRMIGRVLSGMPDTPSDPGFSHATAAILSVGDELVLGQTLDTNTRWIADQLVRRGIAVVEHATCRMIFRATPRCSSASRPRRTW